MKKLAIALFISGAVFSSVQAADVGLVYENEAAVKEGQAVIGSVTSEGVLVSAKFALAHNDTMMMGLLQGKLCKAVLLRLDNKLDIALLQPGDEIQSPALQKSFQDKVASLSAFLPVTPVSGQPVMAPVLLSTEPFFIKINDERVESAPIELFVDKKKSEFKLEVVRPSTVPVWNVEVKLTSEPELSFWKKGKEKKTLNDVPRPTFTYSQQIMLIPLANNRSVKFTVEVHFIKEQNYTFIFKIKSKDGLLEKRVPVVFKPHK